jgi:hypothetical protein
VRRVIPWIIIAVIVVPLVVIAFVAMRRNTAASELPASKDAAARTAQEFAAAEAYEAKWHVGGQGEVPPGALAVIRRAASRIHRTFTAGRLANACAGNRLVGALRIRTRGRHMVSNHDGS